MIFGQNVIRNEAALDSIIAYTKENSAETKSVDWNGLAQKMKVLHQDSGLIVATKLMLKELNDFHGRIWVDHIPHNGINKPWIPSAMQLDDSLVAKYRQTAIPFQAKILEGKVGYLRIPGLIAGPNDSANAYQILEGIKRLSQTEKAKYWIVDLRLNGG